MRLVANCPILYTKTIGAIGGGFSSGKSSFINSLITDQTTFKLAEGIKPVTAIPSYILCDTKARIDGINYRGGSFEISSDMYKEMTHDFLDAFDFDLKEIIPYSIVYAPISKGRFGNLCFIDTPGYDSSAIGAAKKRDIETAREYIKDAHFLIWMVGLDSQGTIPESDLEFLEELEFGKSEARPLYIIATKAELRAISDIEDILDNFQECLDNNDLSCFGICAYSAKTQQIYASRGRDLFEFLAENNAQRNNYSKLIEFLCNAFSPYIAEIYRDDAQKREKRKQINYLLLEGLKNGFTDIESSDNALEKGLKVLNDYFKADESLDTRLERVRRLFNKFLECIDNFCDGLNLEKTDIRTQIEGLWARQNHDFEKNGLFRVLSRLLRI